MKEGNQWKVIWTKERIIDALKKLPQNKPFRKKILVEYKKNGFDICDVSVIQNKFGSIGQACKEADIQYYPYKKIKIWSKEKIIDALKRIHNKYGDFKIAELSKFCKTKELCCLPTIYKFFGKPINALKEAGIYYREHHWSNERIINTLKQLYEQEGPYAKKHINEKFRKEKRLCSESIIRKRFGSLEQAAKYAGIELITLDKNSAFPNIGNQEPEILDNIEKIENIYIARQVQIGRYWVDGYCPELHKIYEVDEPHHKRQIIYDNKRETELLQMTDCSIERIKLW